jgi:DnaK suppressor protein
MTRSISHAPHVSSRPAQRPAIRRGVRPRRPVLQHPAVQHPAVQPIAPRRAAAPPLTLTPERIAGIKQRLETQREFRVEQLTALKYPGAPGPFGSTDREVLASLFSGAKAALHEVQGALWRLEEGTYGLCTGCGAPLDVETLEVVPQTAQCRSCQGSAALPD